MIAVFLALFASLRAGLRTHVCLQLEVLALRHQLAVYQRRHPLTRTQVADRLLWALATLGIHVAKSTVKKYMVRSRRPPSPTWRAFLDDHVKDLASADFSVVPTVAFKILFVFIVLTHARCRIVHFNITEHPTAAWTAQQISEAFPWEAAPRYLIHDRDRAYGPAFRTRLQYIGIVEVLTAPRSPWQNPYAERMIGSIRRDCLDNVIIRGV